MNLKTSSGLVIIMMTTFMICSPTATNTRCQPNVIPYTMDYLHKLTKIPGWTQLKEIRENLEFWKTQLKEKINTYQDPALATALYDIGSITALVAFFGVLVSSLGKPNISAEEHLAIIAMLSRITIAGYIARFLGEFGVTNAQNKLQNKKEILHQLSAISLNS